MQMPLLNEIFQMVESPLNYTGGKFKLLSQILPHFSTKIDIFVDLFCGGCNVGINVSANKIIYNDLNERLLVFYNVLKTLEKETTFDWIYQIIDTYQLSLVSKYGYEYYQSESSKGLSEYNRDRFLKMRKDFNLQASYDDYYYILFYVLIVYSFNNQIRFNHKGEFNLPVGKRDFNKRMAGKLSSFIDRLQDQNCAFSCRDFRSFDFSGLSSDDFVYVDPPYLITCATYNEQGGWDNNAELDLLAILDELTRNNIRFALSNVLRSKGKENRILIDWVNKGKTNIRVIPLNHSYANSSYQSKHKSSSSEEVLIINY